MTPMNLALLLPDWNSLDSVRRAHSSLELWSIWLFAVLVVCDVMAHLVEDNRKALAKNLERIGLCCFAVAVIAELGAYKYGERNDELSQNVITSLDAKAKNAFATASAALTRSGEANTKAEGAKTAARNAARLARGARAEADSFELDIVSAKSQAARAERDLAASMERTKRLEAQLSWRTLTPEQVSVLRKSLSRMLAGKLVPLDSVTIRLSYPMNDEEAAEYADELATALHDLGAKIDGPDAAGYVGPAPKGLIMVVKSARSWGAQLQGALIDAGIVTPVQFDEHATGVEIVVGVKPRPKQ